MIPIEKVKLIVNTYETLEKELAYRDINKKDFVNKSKEYSNIQINYLSTEFLKLDDINLSRDDEDDPILITLPH